MVKKVKKRKPNLSIVNDPMPKPDFSDDSQLTLVKGFNYYNYHNDLKDAQKWVLEWAKTQKYDKNTMKAIRAYDFTMTIGILCKMMLEGYVGKDQLIEKVHYAINKAVLSYVEPVKKVVSIDNNNNIMSVHDRMIERCHEFMGEYVEGEIDDMWNNDGKSDFKLSDLLKSHNIPGKWGSIIAKVYKVEAQDVIDWLNGDKELIEAYPRKKTVMKRILKFYENLIADAEHHVEAKKAVRKTRAKKAPSVEKLVAKVQYKKEDPELKLVSANPTDIIGAKELWLYNTKYRKLIQVFAEDVDMGGVFSIKGTTIQGVGKSEMKTLRKPEEVLTGFSKYGKIKLRKLMSTIKSKGKPFTGRLNKDMIILKIVK